MNYDEAVKAVDEAGAEHIRAYHAYIAALKSGEIDRMEKAHDELLKSVNKRNQARVRFHEVISRRSSK